MRKPSVETAIGLALFALSMVSAPNAAQAQVATTAPIVVSGAGTRLDITTSGTPIVNIAAPAVDGTSHNVFSKFNVGREGAVINNSTVITPTTIAGQVLANPNLKSANVSARLIINEVRSGARSDLLGVVEIAGTRAGLIIANPAGITCNGCGFINTSRTTLTTGVPQFSAAGFTGLAVNGGDVRVEGAGLFGANADYFDIVTGLAQINAEVQAQDLQISGGNQTFNYAGRTSTALAGSENKIVIDSTLLGGMYANRIRLIGTGTGVGINLKGIVDSLNGASSIQADGAVRVREITSGGDLQLLSRASSVTVDEAATSYGHTFISAGTDIQLGKAAIASPFFDPAQAYQLYGFSFGGFYGGYLPNLDAYYAQLAASRITPSIEAFGNISLNAGRDILNTDRGWISGDVVSLSARQDIALSGEAAIYGNGVSLDAGRDISLKSAQRVRSSSQYTDLGKGLYRNTFLTSTEVLGAKIDSYGALVANAGRDIVLETANLSGDGVVSLSAARDVAIGGVASTGTTSSSWKTSKRTTGSSLESVSNFDGSIIGSGLGLLVNAGEEIDITGSLLESDGGISLWADRGTAYIAGSDVNATGNLLVAGRDVVATGSINSSSYDETVRTVKRGFLSKKTTTTTISNDIETVLASTLSGANVSLIADREVAILDSNVAGDTSVDIAAGGDVTISSVPTESIYFTKTKVKKSGFSLGNGGLFLGVAKTSNVVDETQVSNIGSLIGSASGSVRIAAGSAGSGGNLDVVGSQVAALGSVILSGDTVEIVNNVNTVTTATIFKSSSFGYTTFKIEAPLLSTIKATSRIAEAATKSSDGRVQAISLLAGGFAIKNGYDEAKKLANTLKSGEGSLGFSISSSLGFSKTTATSLTIDETIVGSQIAGGDITILSQSAAAPTGISILGSDVAAARDLRLLSSGNIDLAAAIETDQISGTTKSVSASIGTSVSFGLGKDHATGKAGLVGLGASLNFNFGSSSSRYNGVDITARPTVLGAGGLLSISTPRLLNIDGSIVNGNRVEIDAGSLTIASRQNTSSYLAKQRSTGVNLSIGFSFSGITVSGGVNLAGGAQTGNFATVQDQAGIRAGLGGFGINLTGLTELKGGVIASTAAASLNRLRTGTFRVSDISNVESYSANSYNFGFGFGDIGIDPFTGAVTTNGTGFSLPSFLGGFSFTLPTYLTASGNQSSTTRSAISPASVFITSGEAASLSALSTLSRDTTAAHNALTKQFTEAKRAEIEQSFESVRQLVTQTTVFFANRAAEEKVLRDAAEAAKARGDITTYNRLTGEADTINKATGSSSALKLITTAITGAAGANVSSGLTGLARGTAVNILQGLAVTKIKAIADSFGDDVYAGVDAQGRVVYTKRPNAASETIRAALQGLAGCAGAAAGNASCTSGALGASASVALNLIVDALDKEKRIDTNRDGVPDSYTLEAQQARTALIATLTGALAAALNGDPGTAITAGRLETDRNFLGNRQKLARDKEIVNCGDSKVCRIRVGLKYQGISVSQDAVFGAGVVVGVGTQLADDVKGFIDLIKDPKAAYEALKALANDPQIREKLGDAVKKDIDAKIATLNRAGEYGGYPNAREAGEAVGSAAFTLLGVATGVYGAAKLTVKLASVAGKVIKKVDIPKVPDAPPRFAAGVELDPRLPDPLAGVDYAPSRLRGGTEANKVSQINGYRAELELANTIADLPGHTVVRYGSNVNSPGADVVAVRADGTVSLYDTKFRSNPTNIASSGTFEPNSTRLANAVEQARIAIDKSTSLSPAARANALENLRVGNFNAHTPGAGAVRNSAIRRFCGHKICGS